MPRPQIKFMIIALFACLVLAQPGLAFYGVWTENFQSYGSAYDPGMTAKFMVFNGTMGAVNQYIVQAPYDSLSWHVQAPNQLVGGVVSIQFNETMTNTTYPFTFDFLLKNGSSFKATQNGQAEMYWYFYTNHSNADRTRNFSTSRGYLLTLAFPATSQGATNTTITATLARCPANLTTSISTGYWSCTQVLSTSSFNTKANTGIQTSGAYNYPLWWQNWAMTTDVRMKLVATDDGTIKLFLNPDSSNDVERLSFKDVSPIWNNGSIIFGMATQVGYSGGGIDFYIDDMEFLNYSSYVSAGNNTLTLVSYPGYQANNLTLVDRVNNTIASWVAVNQPFAVQYSFSTPAGLMNQITEMSCPVRMFGEYACESVNGVLHCDTASVIDPNTHDNPILQFQATDTASINKCSVIDEYSNAELYNYGYLCYSPGSCLISWSAKETSKTTFIQTISSATTWTSSGQWKNLYKVLDTNGKLAYISTDIVCSAPANITIAVEYYDLRGCASVNPATNTSLWFKLFNLSIGTDPATNTTCDYQLNASCWTGSEGTPSLPPFFNGTQIPGLTNYTSGVVPQETPASQQGITDIFNSEQSGGIVNALLTPAFLAMFACLAVGAGVGYFAGPMIGVMGFIGSVVVLTGYGLFPLWMGMAILILCAFGVALFMRGIFT